MRICLISPPQHRLSILDFLTFLEGELGFMMQFSFQMGGLTGSMGLCIRWPCEFDWLVRKRGHGIDSTNSLVVSWFHVHVSAQSPSAVAARVRHCSWSPYCGHSPAVGREAPPYFFGEACGSRGGCSSLGICHRWFTSDIFSLRSVCSTGLFWELASVYFMVNKKYYVYHEEHTLRSGILSIIFKSSSTRNQWNSSLRWP